MASHCSHDGGVQVGSFCGRCDVQGLRPPFGEEWPPCTGGPCKVDGPGCNPVTLEVSRDGLTGGLQLSINHKAGGYRIYGPKFSGTGKVLVSAIITKDVAKEIQRYLAIANPPAVASGPWCLQCDGPPSAGCMGDEEGVGAHDTIGSVPYT